MNNILDVNETRWGKEELEKTEKLFLEVESAATADTSSGRTSGSRLLLTPPGRLLADAHGSISKDEYLLPSNLETPKNTSSSFAVWNLAALKATAEEDDGNDDDEDMISIISDPMSVLREEWISSFDNHCLVDMDCHTKTDAAPDPAATDSDSTSLSASSAAMISSSTKKSTGSVMMRLLQLQQGQMQRLHQWRLQSPNYMEPYPTYPSSSSESSPRCCKELDSYFVQQHHNRQNLQSCRYPSSPSGWLSSLNKDEEEKHLAMAMAKDCSKFFIPNLG